MEFTSHPVQVMGILNASPDSFYPPSRCGSVKDVLNTAETFLKEGADLLDIGAESSRPGSLPISAEDEIARLLPLVSALCREFDVPISVDTCKPQVAERVLQEGVGIINDITGLSRYPEMAELIARHDAGVVLMHMQGTPESMQKNPVYSDVVGEISLFLKKAIATAENAGIDPEKIIVDPGIGFGKTLEHNLQILHHLKEFKALNKPLLLGVSRKGFMGQVLGLPMEERLEASLAVALYGLGQGVNILRVHDVRETVQMVQLIRAIEEERN